MTSKFVCNFNLYGKVYIDFVFSVGWVYIPQITFHKIG